MPDMEFRRGRAAQGGASLAILALMLLVGACGGGGETDNGAVANTGGGGSVLAAEDRPEPTPPVDLNGVWVPQTSGSLAAATAPQLTEAGRRQQAANRAAADPAARCLPPGVPRVMTVPRPIEISVNADMVMMNFEVQRLVRLIRLGDRLAINPDPAFLGTADARWDGKALVIDTHNLKAGGWLDSSGLPFGPKLKVTERIERTGADTLVDHVTVTDPEMYAAPWTADIVLKRKGDGVMDEDVCVERVGIHPRGRGS